MATNIFDVMEAVLTGFDTSMTKACQEEEALWHSHVTEWRAQDTDWMRAERCHWVEEAARRARKDRWREEEIMQRNLENARCLWLRFVEKNRRDVEEKTEQLKVLSNLAAIFAGFAIVTLTQFQLNPASFHVLSGIYGVLTAIVEGLMTISMVTCTLIMGCILKRGKTYVNELCEEEFIFDCLEFCENFREGDTPPSPKRTLESFWDSRCECSWQWAFHCFSIGVSLFLLSMITIGWIKYSGQSKLTATFFVSVLGIAIFVWFETQYSWGAYLRKRKLAHDQKCPYKGYGGLPYDWFLAPRKDEREL